MQRRIIAAVAAVLLAGIGAVLLYSYVNTSEVRAMARMQPVPVLVATRAIPAGTTGAELAAYVELKQLPEVAVVAGALTDTSSIVDRVATSELQVGEQILPTRFAAPDTAGNGEVEVPTDMQQLSIVVDGPRAVGAAIRPGAKIGIFISGEDKESEAGITQLTLRDVLVVRVQGGPAGEEEDAAAPAGPQVITLALRPADATRVVYGVEHLKIYLALEPKDGGEGTHLVTAKTVLK